jgi:hypothetical protein
MLLSPQEKDVRAEKKNFISALEENRSVFFELVVVAVLISLAINLIGNGVSTQLSTRYSFWIAGSILLGTLVYLCIRRLSSLSGSFDYEGFLLYDAEARRLVSVPEYPLCEEAASYLVSALAEDEALKIFWEKNPLRAPFRKNPNGGDTVTAEKSDAIEYVTIVRRDANEDDTDAQKPSVAVVGELLEYVCLEWLSTHLTDFFNKEGFDQLQLREFHREDIPEILLKNRFLDLFSRPTERRPMFLRDSSIDRDKEGEVVSVYLPRLGAEYHKFDLTVPRGATLRKLDSCGFSIVSPLIILTIEPIFSGYNTVVPPSFLRHYVGYQGNLYNLSEFKVTVKVTYRMKWWGIFAKTGWKYHRWAESFGETLEHSVSRAAFFEKIGWSTLDAWLRCISIVRPGRSSQVPTEAPAAVPSSESAAVALPERPSENHRIG